MMLFKEIVPNFSFNNYNLCSFNVMTSNYVKQKKKFKNVNSFRCNEYILS